ncbi:peptidoglycan/LPS O-acetylase OafA/YrhL [Microbacterium sp. BE35]|nr:peptidoglycan/LPS O-acetylase OafA/YrhL [Microbacterium sp. BE35]
MDRVSAQPDHSGFRADIQGLRAIAVGSVLLYHAGVPFLPGGYVGVDVFFVISGFLITSHLLGQLESHGTLRFGEFYARRARRILPASFVVLTLSVAAALIWYPPLLMKDLWAAAVATALYVPNYFFASANSDYLAESSNPSLFQHYWSLGVEEQFYLLWPALLALVWVLARSRRALLGVLIGVVAASFALCVWLTFTAQPWAFFSLPSRAWELCVGGSWPCCCSGGPGSWGSGGPLSSGGRASRRSRRPCPSSRPRRSSPARRPPFPCSARLP